jgi:hypothetical protein
MVQELMLDDTSGSGSQFMSAITILLSVVGKRISELQ